MITFSTHNLEIHDYASVVRLDRLSDNFLKDVIAILTPVVVKELPPYFHHINNKSAAQDWLDKMSTKSRLLLLYQTSSNELVGFVFLYETSPGVNHIGYLLAKKVWGKGFAGEVLSGLLEYLKKGNTVKGLIAGVSPTNIASIKVLEKTGFRLTDNTKQDVFYYEYIF